MNVQWIDVLACLECRGRLDADGANGRDLIDGVLRCVGCGREFPVQDEIVSGLDIAAPATAEEELKQCEILERDEGAHDYDGHFLPFETEVELRAILDRLQPAADDLVIELGIGTARHAQVYGRHVRGVLGVDFSRRCLEVARERLKSAGVNYCLVHADVCQLPVGAATFTKAISPQVLEHIPSEESRRQNLAEAARILMPGGLFLITVYHDSLLKRIRRRVRPGEGNVKEGRHGGGIYFLRFNRSELRDLLGEQFHVGKLTGLCSAPHTLQKLGPIGASIERAVQKTPFSFAAANLLLGMGWKATNDGWSLA